VNRLRSRVVRAADNHAELTLYELDRATEIRYARCAGRQATGVRCHARPDLGLAVVPVLRLGHA
jgi:hypothetical protein